MFTVGTMLISGNDENCRQIARSVLTNKGSFFRHVTFIKFPNQQSCGSSKRLMWVFLVSRLQILCQKVWTVMHNQFVKKRIALYSTLETDL